MGTHTLATDLKFLSEKVEVFFNLFEPSIQLAEELIAAQRHPQEVVLLLCARLDALASCISDEGQSNRESFIRLLVKYSGHRDLMRSISAGDLFYELGYHRWLAEGMIPKAGRLVRFSKIDDPIIQFLDRSGIALTVDSAERLFTRVMRIVSGHFRCRSGQPRRKPMTGSFAEFMRLLREDFQKTPGLVANLEAAVKPLLESKSVAALLYEKVRNEAVHGLVVDFDERRFFREQRPYWELLYSEHYPPFMFIRFPAQFLVELLRKCINTVKREMIATGKLPPDVFFKVFGYGSENLDFLNFLDSEKLSKPAPLRFQRR